MREARGTQSSHEPGARSVGVSRDLGKKICRQQKTGGNFRQTKIRWLTGLHAENEPLAHVERATANLLILLFAPCA